MVRVFDWEGVEFLIGNVIIHYLLCEWWVFDWDVEGGQPGTAALWFGYFLFGVML